MAFDNRRREDPGAKRLTQDELRSIRNARNSLGLKLGKYASIVAAAFTASLAANRRFARAIIPVLAAGSRARAQIAPRTDTARRAQAHPPGSSRTIQRIAAPVRRAGH